tara:strand:- start:1029 stop:1247 length:219 start_codon:yes stop_codon:yes gene_type:complete
MNDTKTYTVRFLPNDELEYEFVVEAESEDEAENLANDELGDAIGWDAAKDWHISNIKEVVLYGNMMLEKGEE